RIPESERERVHVIDLRHPHLAVGINVLESPRIDQQPLVADQVVEIFHQLFAASWGKRSEHVLRAAVLTLLKAKDATLCDLPALLLDAKSRGYWTRNLDDPIGLGSFWQEFNALSDSQRQEWTGPLVYKIRDLLLSPQVRHLFGQVKSTIDLAGILQNREVLLITLPPGEIGRPTMQLVGSILLARIWQLVQARSAIAEELRPPTVGVIDEFKEILKMSKAIDEVADQARSFRFGLLLANQDLGQLKPYPGIERAVRSNIRSKLFFQPQHEEEALAMSKLMPGITPEQLLQLRSRQLAVRVCIDGVATAPFTAYTLPLPDSEMDKASIKRRQARASELVESAMERDARARAEVESELRERRFKVQRLAENTAPAGVPWA
ncbi:MAG: type IV secretory system conjugative DNA transfer family protein, partial [Candidatus Dormibacteraceae bacterium]